LHALAGTLPGGYWDAEGTLHRGYELASLTGREEELLLEASERAPAELVTEVLARGISSLGDISPVPERVAQQMLVGDRQYLLLRLRQATFGEHVRAGLICPWADCGRRVTVEFALSDVPVIESVDKGPRYSMQLSTEAASGSDADRRVTFRLPTGADQEEIAGWLPVNEAHALTVLLERCVEDGPDKVPGLSPRARAEIDEHMQQLAPGVEQVMEAGCAECGRTFLVPFDVQRFFFGELRADHDYLYRQVHYLAYHYHWSEHDIMSMSRDKRRIYLEVLADEIDRLNDGS
jgi:hypothetical protein